MTRKERALKSLKQMCSDGRYLGSGSYVPLEVLEDFEVAIKALEQEPTTKNDFGVDCISRADAIKAMQDKAKKLKNEDTINGLCGAVAILYEMPSVTPQLSIPEVTALAEWIEKLTKECEEAYNKGFTDGVKSVNICPHCGEYIGEEE